MLKKELFISLPSMSHNFKTIPRLSQNLVKSFHQSILDTLFPIQCLGCGKGEEWICEQCLRRVPCRLDQVCPICEKRNTPDGRVCFSCADKSDIDGIYVCSSYSNPILSKAIQYYKYRFAEDLSLPLGKIMAESLQKSELLLPDLIIPIPLHRYRLRWRGFNQSELLADYLSDNFAPGFQIPVEKKTIKRIKFTYPQMKIKNYRDRRKNIQGVFEIENDTQSIIQDKRILLVDDVATTGATLFECARVLKSAGANEIFAVVLARQETKRNK
jgi:competence protein ComFC